VESQLAEARSLPSVENERSLTVENPVAFTLFLNEATFLLCARSKIATCPPEPPTASILPSAQNFKAERSCPVGFSNR